MKFIIEAEIIQSENGSLLFLILEKWCSHYECLPIHITWWKIPPASFQIHSGDPEQVLIESFKKIADDRGDLSDI
jgi:hypothetical protein